jgi:DNA polymerase-3 subunit alpha
LIKDAKGKVELDIDDLRYKTDEFYFRTQSEMIKLFSDCPEAIASTIEIADKCNLKLELGKPYMPEFPIPTSVTADEYLKELVFEGLKQRYSTLTDEITKRAEYELEVIAKMKYPGYFLIV